MPLLTGLALLLLGAALAAVGILQLAAASLDPLLVLWIGLPLLGGPLAMWSAYELYGVATAAYQLDRDGLTVRWGLAHERIPLGQIQKMERAEAAREFSPSAGLHLPGVRVGAGDWAGALVEYFATDLERALLLHCEGKILVLSPPDPDGLVNEFVRYNRMGSLQRVEPSSQRPNLLPAQIWADGLARWLLLAGLLAPLGLLAYLVLQAGSLPAEVPFGFLPSGEPAAPAPAGRLLLLPLVAGLVWLVNLLLGAWLYRRQRDRALSYALWSAAVLVAGLLWGAAAQLLAAAS